MVISFSSQKGGGGKTTSSMAFATYVNHYFDDIKICVVDIDLQMSFYNKRSNELKFIKQLQQSETTNYNSKYIKSLNRLVRDSKTLYPVYTVNFETEDLIEKIKQLENKFDLVLIDFPGTLDKKQISELLLILDYIFIPIHVEDKNLRSALEYEIIISKVKALQKDSPGSSRLIDHYMYFFKYSSYENQNDWNFLESFLRKKNIKKLNEYIYDSKKIEMEVSTINTISGLTKDKDVVNFANEIMSIIFPRKYEYNNERKELKHL